MSRHITQHRIVTNELWDRVHVENKQLLEDFLIYLRTIDRSESTIQGYKQDLRLIFVWGVLSGNNKPFPEWTKPKIAAIQNWFISQNKNSPARVARLKASMSSLSKYIEDILDDDYLNYKNIIHRIPNPPMRAVLEKSVIPEEDLVRLIDYLTLKGKYQQACLLALALFSGRRKAELLRFKASDFTKRHLVCSGALYRSDRIKTKGSGKDGKLLNCYTLARRFRPYLFNWLYYRDTYGIQSDWLFPSPVDCMKALSETALDNLCGSYSVFLGMPFYWHAVRHATVTSFKRAGIPDSIIKTYIGWENVNMVDIYADIQPEEELSKYFTVDGIIIPETKSIVEL